MKHYKLWLFLAVVIAISIAFIIFKLDKYERSINPRYVVYDRYCYKADSSLRFVDAGAVIFRDTSGVYHHMSMGHVAWYTNKSEGFDPGKCTNGPYTPSK